MNNEDFIKKNIDKIISNPQQPIDEKFEHYCKLYEERFGKRAYIAEPSGTKEQTINAIKICLEKNEDLLDKLLYPNLEDDLNNGILYSETKKDLKDNKFLWNAGDIKIAKTQCEFCKHNNNERPNICSQYPNGKPNKVINNTIKCSSFYNPPSILT